MASDNRKIDEVVNLNADNLDTDNLDQLSEDALEDVAGGSCGTNIQCGTNSSQESLRPEDGAS